MLRMEIVLGVTKFLVHNTGIQKFPGSLVRGTRVPRVVSEAKNPYVEYRGTKIPPCAH